PVRASSPSVQGNPFRALGRQEEMMTTRIPHGLHRGVLAAVLMCAAGGVFSTSNAQVTSITSSGLGTTVSQAGTTWNITGGTRPGNGPNLFHSFGDFSLNAPERANFLNDSGRATTNILSRVTGGNPSNIFGTIDTTAFPRANLFLMNPSAIPSRPP